MPDEGRATDREVRAAARVRRQLAVARAAGDLDTVVDPSTGEPYYYATPQGLALMESEAQWDTESEVPASIPEPLVMPQQRGASHAAPRRRSRRRNTLAGALAVLALPSILLSTAVAGLVRDKAVHTSQPDVPVEDESAPPQQPEADQSSPAPLEEGRAPAPEGSYSGESALVYTGQSAPAKASKTEPESEHTSTSAIRQPVIQEKPQDRARQRRPHGSPWQGHGRHRRTGGTMPPPGMGEPDDHCSSSTTLTLRVF